MNPEQKAKELYETFTQYNWNDLDGYMPDDVETKKITGKVIDEIERQADNWGVISVKVYWSNVRASLNAI